MRYLDIIRKYEKVDNVDLLPDRFYISFGDLYFNICNDKNALINAIETSPIITLHSDKGVIGKVIRFFTRSSFNHTIGFFKDSNRNDICKIESLPEAGVTVSKEWSFGLKSIFQNSDIKAIMIPKDPKAMILDIDKAISDLKLHGGLKYEHRLISLFRLLLPIQLRKLLKIESNGGYFCSELVLSLLAKNNIEIPTPTLYTPGDFLPDEISIKNKAYVYFKENFDIFLVFRIKGNVYFYKAYKRLLNPELIIRQSWNCNRQEYPVYYFNNYILLIREYSEYKKERIKNGY